MQLKHKLLQIQKEIRAKKEYRRCSRRMVEGLIAQPAHTVFIAQTFCAKLLGRTG